MGIVLCWQQSQLITDQVKNNYGKFNIHFPGPSVWNNLDENLNQSSSLHLFKQTMKAIFYPLILLMLASMT